jgi:predicted PurR-regulated permease PerM
VVMENTNAIKNILMVFLIALLVYLMALLSALLVPLAMALLFALFFYPLQLQLIKWKIPKVLTIPIIILFSTIVFTSLISIVVMTGIEMADDMNYFSERLSYKFDGFFNWLESVTYQKFDFTSLLEMARQHLNLQNITNFIGSVVGSIGNFSGSFVIFMIYYIILLSGMTNYKKYITYVSGDKIDSKMLKNFEQIQQNLIFYIKYKSLLNFISTAIFTIILFSFGIKFALFWGVLNFFLNFIPNFGSLFALIFVGLMGLVQFDSLNTLVLLMGLLLLNNFIMGSIVEPKVMGNKLSLNTLTVIFGLFFWGYIWGIPGMFLAVPLLVITKVIFESFPGLAFVGRLMGYSGSKEN